jgi:two-component system sensor histidine kinase KdpD
MLEEGRARAAEGMDVVVGYAEPHARSDTEALLLGMELLPYKFVEYKNVRLKEFDLDAAIQRHPAVLLVDELAHTNAPGMRHPKRYQDVLELLEAGIDVYTTLNVQHLESVNDIVERITGIKVRETLPDSVLEQADDVELVDIAPAELLERIQEGKVYTGETAERATRNFFSKGNLMALRELALRRTAERVDAQMEDFRRENRVRELWPTSERLLVCISPSPLSARLVRAGKRLATGLKAEWIAAYVETPHLTQVDRDRAIQTLRLAQQLGAETMTLTGEHISEEILSCARERNVTRIIIGKPERSRWREVIFGSVVDEVIRGSGSIDIYVIRGEAEEVAGAGDRPVAPPLDWTGYAWAATLVAVCTGIEFLVTGIEPGGVEGANREDANLIMGYLVVVMIIAARFGRGPGIVASMLSVAAFDFFFVTPRYTFAVSDFRYMVTFGVMLLVAIVISTLTDRVRRQAESSRRRERRTAALLAFSRELAATREIDGLLDAAVRQISEVFDSQVAILMPNSERRLVVRAHRAAAYEVDEKETSVALWVFDHNQAAGLGTATLPAAKALYLPLTGSQGPVGVMGIRPPKDAVFQDPDQLRLLEAFAGQAAAAIERARLAEDARSAWERVEAEFMRNTLLSSVSHDLRTPLAAITGAASTLLETGPALADSARQELIETVYEESERMDRLINNLLDMTRLESGGLHPRKEWQPIQEVIGSALHHLDKRLVGREVRVDVTAELPLVHFDAISIEQVLMNLLDNALEYTPPGSPIEIKANRTEGGVAVEVLDRGPGLPSGAEQRVFEKFFRAHPVGESGRRGIGLGLAISRGIVEAHGGKITADNRPGGGARFVFTIPVNGTPPVVNALG